MSDEEVLGEGAEEEFIEEWQSEQSVEEESVLTHYDPEDLVSGAVLSPESTIPPDLFVLQDSLGYDSMKQSNLCVVADDVICWCAGSVVVFMDVEQQDTWLQRSTTGGSVTCVQSYRVEPHYRLAVGEAKCGVRGARLVLYLWPLQLDAVLAHDEDINAIDFSPDGSLLVTAGACGNLTVWRWQKRRILLRASRASIPETVMFSEHVEDSIATAGAAHIQFWKMADTFTGLKLKGELGRFGKTEICDIIGVYPMPDAKVLSGSSWGNILVWEASLVKLEVTRRGRKPCHKGPVVQLMLNAAGEVVSAGMDGCVCTWYWEAVHTADPPEDDPYIELNPVAEISIPDCEMMCLKHDKEKYWYVQDGSGGIWHLHIEEGDSRRVMRAGGAVAGAATGEGGWLALAVRRGMVRLLAGSGQRAEIAAQAFSAEICCTMHVSQKTLLMGMSDGTVRIVHVEQASGEATAEGAIKVIGVVKPHTAAIACMAVRPDGELLVTASADCTLFVYKVMALPELHPLFYVRTRAPVTHIAWHGELLNTLLLCMRGGLLEATIDDQEAGAETFEVQFTSARELLLNNQFIRHRPPPVKDEDDFLESSDDEEVEEEEEYIGEVELVECDPVEECEVTWATYCGGGEAWVTLRDVGAIIKVCLRTGRPLCFMPLPAEEAWEHDITAILFVCDGQYLLTGTATGEIRVMRVPEAKEPEDEAVFKVDTGEPEAVPRLDCEDHYWLPMHEHVRGAIRCFVFTADGKHMYTCGDDGNVFSYAVNFAEPMLQQPPATQLATAADAVEVAELDRMVLSHEEQRQKELMEMRLAAANAHKRRVRATLADLAAKYRHLSLAERALPASLRTPPPPLAVRPPQGPPVQLAHLLEAAELALRKMADRNVVPVEVYPFALMHITDPTMILRPLRQKGLSRTFHEQMEEVRKEMSEAAARARATVAPERAGRDDRVVRREVAEAASFLNLLPPRPPHALAKAVRYYRQRLDRHQRHLTERYDLLQEQEETSNAQADSTAVLRAARESLGARALRTEAHYVAPPHCVPLRLCQTRQQIFENKHEFNEKVVALRAEKVRLVEEQRRICERLTEIRAEIPAKLVRMPPVVPTIHEDLEFPEKNLEVRPEPIHAAAKAEQAKKSRSTAFPQARVKQARVARFVSIIESRPLAAAWEILKPRTDKAHTAIEVELRERRIRRHLYEQESLLQESESMVHKFDAKLVALLRERIRVQEKNVLLELHQIQLHRELDVINRFAGHEGRLQLRVHEKLLQVRAVQEKIAACQAVIADIISRKGALDAACQELQKLFRRMTVDNKFSDFLRRIFKKKYRPPRGRDDEESSEEESSTSSSEEEDEGSLDSRDIGPIRLDPNICPEGCERALYDKTYELRNIRHSHEQEMIELDRQVELQKKEIEAHNKEKRKLGAQLEQRQVELKEFMVEKQSCLNEIDQVVVLRYEQIRAAALAPVDVLVFPAAALTALRARVLQLHAEIARQKDRFRVSRRHMRRLCTDLRALEERRLQLAEETRRVLRQKLGRTRGRAHKVLDDALRLEVTRFKCAPLLDQLLEQLCVWKRRHCELEQKYMNALESHSARLRVAAAIQAELTPPAPSGAKTRRSLSSFRRDVVRLRLVRQLQLSQIQTLDEEIHNLKMKSEVIPAPSMASSDRSVPHGSTAQIVSDNIRKYFPIEPQLGEAAPMSSRVMKLLTDVMTRVLAAGRTRHEAAELLTGAKSDDGSTVREDVAALLDYLVVEHMWSKHSADVCEEQSPAQVLAELLDDERTMGALVAALGEHCDNLEEADVDALVDNVMAAQGGGDANERRLLSELASRVLSGLQGVQEVDDEEAD